MTTQQEIPTLQLGPVRADVFQAAVALMHAGKAQQPMTPQAQAAVSAVTDWIATAQPMQQPAAPANDPSKGE